MLCDPFGYDRFQILSAIIAAVTDLVLTDSFAERRCKERNVLHPVAVLFLRPDLIAEHPEKIQKVLV